MQGTIQKYTLDMADGTALKPLIVKQGDTNSRFARISLVAFKEPWTIPFGCQIHINVHKNDGTYANATCTQEDEHTVLAPITEQMTAVPGTQLGELFFLGVDGDIRSQTFPLVVWDAVSDLDRMVSSDDFQALKEALRDVKVSTEVADIAAQYATEQGNSARDGAQRANDAADSIQVAVDAAANAKACESNAKNSELAAAQTQQEVTDYVEAQKAAFVGYSQRESDSKYANALTETVTGEGSITVEDAWTSPVLGLNVAGKSEQMVTTGAQLLDSSKIIIGGLSGDKGAEFETQARVRTGYISVTEGDVYKLSGYAPYVVHNAFVYGADKTMTGAYNIGSAVPQNAAYVRISLKKSDEGNFTVDDLATLKKSLMFNVGSAVLPYEPYTGGAPSPSPDYPQDIISVGTVSTGKQLINASRIPSKTAGGVTLTNNGDGSFTISGSGELSAGFSTYYSLTHEESQRFFPAGKYSIATKSTPYLYVNFKNATGTLASLSYISGVKEITTEFVNDDGYYVNIGFTGNVGQSITPVTIWPMLNAGNTALPWEPYTGGKPSPSVEYPQTLEVRVAGAQLFDADKVTSMTAGGATVTNNGDGSFTVSGSGALTNKINRSILFTRDQTLTILRAGNYCMSGAKTYPYFHFTLYDTVEKTVVFEINTKGTPSKEITQALINNEKLVLRIGFYGAADAPITPGVVWPMVNVGDTALPWEPYRSATAPTTLTEPLRGIGDYRDRIMCRDGVWGIERWVIEEAIYIRSIIKLSNGKTGGICNKPGSDNIKGVFCSNASKTISNSQMSCGQFYENPANIVLIGDEDDTIETLREKYKEGYFAFVTDIPTWEPLPDATQQALNALTTYAGTTHLTITAGGPAPTVTLDYVQDTHKALEQCQEAAKEYTDNQLANIVAALPTATQAAIVDNQTTRLLQEV